MFKLFNIATGIRVTEDAIQLQRERSDLVDREYALLEKLADKHKEMWALIRDYEDAVEQGDTK